MSLACGRMSPALTRPKKWCQRFAAASPAYELYAPRGRRWRAWLRASCAAVIALIFGGRLGAQTLLYADFQSAAGLQVNGHAAIADGAEGGKVIRLAPRPANQIGSFFTGEAVGIAQFSIVFEFQMPSRLGGDQDDTGRRGGDGLTFVIQTAGPTAIGNNSSSLGYEGFDGQSVAIEFDTFRNAQAQIGDLSSNHIGFNVNGSVASVPAADVPENFDDGQKWTARIDYNGTALEVRVAASNVRPALATWSFMNSR